MLPDDVVPKMLFDEVVGCTDKDNKHNHAKTGKQHVHPFFAQEVDFEMFMLMSVSGVLVAEVAARKGCYENCKPHEHHYSFGSEMPFFAVTFSFMVLMDAVAFAALRQVGTVSVVCLVAMSAVDAAMHKVRDYADGYGKDKKYDEDNQRLVRNHGEHYKGFVTGRRNHHCYECAEAQKTVGIERNRGESSHASGNRAEKGPDNHLTDSGLLQSSEHQPVGFNVQRFDHHHHYRYQPRDQDRVPQGIHQYFKCQFHL